MKTLDEPTARSTLAAPRPRDLDRRSRAPRRQWLSHVWALAYALVITAFVGSAGAISVVVPAFEAPDEPSHFGYVRHVVDNRAIPSLLTQTSAANEAGQPPLYYVVAASASLLAGDWTASATRLPTWEDSNDLFDVVPRFREGADSDNRSLFAHRSEEGWPFRDDALALHIARLVSTAFGALAVVATILTARELWPARPGLALAAGALLALNPQFIFISGVASNDSAAAGTASLTLLLLLRAMRRGLTRARAATIGLALGLALLAKLSLLALVPIVGLGVAVAAGGLERGAVRRLWAARWRVVVLASTTALVSGWWYVGNLASYGDPTAWEPMLAAQGQMIRPLSIPAWSAVAQLFAARDTYWATFGWTNVVVERRLYVAADLVLALAILGLGASTVVAVRRHLRSAWSVGGASAHLARIGILALWTLAVSASLVRWVQINEAAAQGRLMFPAAGAIAILIALGLTAMAPRRVEWVVGLVLVAGLVGLGQDTFREGIVDAYEHPRPVALSEQSGESIERLDVACDCGISLIGYRYAHLPLTSDDTLVVELLWRSDDRSTRYRDQNWSFDVGLRDPAGDELAKRIGWPGGGKLATTATELGAVHRERIELPLPRTRSAPGAGTVSVKLYATRDGFAQGNLSGPDGEPLGDSVALGRFRWPAEPVDPGSAHRLNAALRGGPSLVAAEIPATIRSGEAVPIALYWRADRAIERDYSVSIQALDEEGRLVGQADSQPRDGLYPMTLWPSGEVVADERSLVVDAPSGAEVRFVVVVYDLNTGERLALDAAPSAAGPDRAIEAARRRVVGR